MMRISAKKRRTSDNTLSEENEAYCYLLLFIAFILRFYSLTREEFMQVTKKWHYTIPKCDPISFSVSKILIKRMRNTM